MLTKEEITQISDEDLREMVYALCQVMDAHIETERFHTIQILKDSMVTLKQQRRFDSFRRWISKEHTSIQDEFKGVISYFNEKVFPEKKMVDKQDYPPF